MSTPAKPAKKAAKPKKPAAHPKYADMIAKAISSLKERGGSSRQAIGKYIMVNFNVGKDSNAVMVHIKMALKRGVAKGSLKQVKGVGASGSFKVAEKKKAAPKKAKKPAKAKKPKSPKKKKAAKKPAAKKAAKPKKAKSPKKKAAKPKKAKPAKAKPAKKAAAKGKGKKK